MSSQDIAAIRMSVDDTHGHQEEDGIDGQDDGSRADEEQDEEVLCTQPETT